MTEPKIRSGSILSRIILDEPKRIKYQYIWIYAILGVVALGMSIVNLATDKRMLLLATMTFFFACVYNIVLTLVSPFCQKVAAVLFTIEILLLLTFFIVSGMPEGFSAIWAALLPTGGMLLFGRRRATLINTVMFVIIVFLFETPGGQSLLLYDYTDSFKLRFPMLFFAFFAVAFFFETVRMMTFSAYRYLYTHDELTDTLNRHGFNEQIRGAFDSPGGRVGFMILDIDHFKDVNDRLGHAAGDIVLKEVAALLSECVEHPVTRWGGEEFSAFFPSGELGQMTCDAICERFREHVFTIDGGLKLTVSIGAVLMTKDESLTADRLFAEADKCLYMAKGAGRDRAVFVPFCGENQDDDQDDDPDSETIDSDSDGENADE